MVIFGRREGGGGCGVNKLYCGLCENGEFNRDQLQIDLLFKVQLTPKNIFR